MHMKVQTKTMHIFFFRLMLSTIYAHLFAETSSGTTTYTCLLKETVLLAHKISGINCTHLVANWRLAEKIYMHYFQILLDTNYADIFANGTSTWYFICTQVFKQKYTYIFFHRHLNTTYVHSFANRTSATNYKHLFTNASMKANNTSLFANRSSDAVYACSLTNSSNTKHVQLFAVHRKYITCVY